ncbi:MAG TPA: transporter substrate-binding domain-containing protein [Stellaceae bacterium]|nr:transporter substrate-binding domain-containing protein [Stellaceae bacterium]
MRLRHFGRLLSAGLAFVLLAALGAAPAAAQDQTSILNQVLKRGTVRIATQPGNPPYSSMTPSGEPEGFDIEIGKLIAAALKVKPEWVTVDTPGRITALQTHRADLTISNFTNNTERSTVVAFTRPYLVVGSKVMVLKDSKLQTIDDVNDSAVKIGISRGGTSEQNAIRIAPKATIVRFDMVQDATLALKSGQVDVQVMDSLLNASILAKDNGASFRNIPGNYSYEEIAIGLPAGDFDWWRVIDGFVRQFVNSGDDAKLFKKYFGYDMPPIR